MARWRRHRVTCPALEQDSTSVGNGWQTQKCIRYDDGDIHRISPSMKSATAVGARGKRGRWHAAAIIWRKITSRLLEFRACEGPDFRGLPWSNSRGITCPRSLFL